ncbi:MAG: hypothetical protein HON90_01490, partial [Halobacteriovoraceae bacterium]|nr:hypothetical protein [Halobacteriovoraceae bacterium]
MKTVLITTTLIILSNLANAGISTRILHINAPESIDESYEVLIAKNKTVLKVSPQSTELISKLYQAEELNSVVDLTIEDDNLLQLSVLEAGDDILDFYPSEDLHPMSNYTPSNVSSVELAEKMFKG